MKLRVECPHFRALCRDGSAWMLEASQAEAFRDTWMAGKAWWRGRCVYGSDVTVKLADITGLSVWDDARLAVEEEEETERKARALKGDPA